MTVTSNDSNCVATTATGTLTLTGKVTPTMQVLDGVTRAVIGSSASSVWQPNFSFTVLVNGAAPGPYISITDTLAGTSTPGTVGGWGGGGLHTVNAGRVPASLQRLR